jgi:hypothetical protein
MIRKNDDMLFGEFLDHLETIGDNPVLAEAWIESLPERDRNRMLRTFLAFHEARLGSRVGRLKVRRIAWQETRVVRSKARHALNDATRNRKRSATR